jgi:hypothetical protein
VRAILDQRFQWHDFKRIYKCILTLHILGIIDNEGMDVFHDYNNSLFIDYYFGT